MLVQLVKGDMVPPMEILSIIRRIRHLTSSCFSISHSFRQANTVADGLAAVGSVGQARVYTNFSQLLKEVRGACNMDRLQIPSFKYTRVYV